MLCPPTPGQERKRDDTPSEKSECSSRGMGNGYRAGQKAHVPWDHCPPPSTSVPLQACRGSQRVGLATALSRGGGALDPDLAHVPAGIEFVVTQLKSLVLTLGLMDLRLTVEQAVLLSRLEEEYQVRSRLCPPWFGLGGGGEGGLGSPRTVRLYRFGLSRLSRTSRNQNSGPMKVLSKSSNSGEQ